MALALRPTIPSQPSTANPLSGGLSDGLAAFISFGNPRGYDAVNQQYAKTASHTLRFVHGDLSADYSGTQQTIFANAAQYSQTDAFTLAAIVDVDALSNWGHLAACQDTVTTNGWELRIGELATNGRVLFHRANAGGFRQFALSSSAVPAGSTNLLIAVQVPTGNIQDAPTFVVNDASISAAFVTGTGTGAATASTADLYLGRRSDGVTQLDGAIKAFAIWSRVLSLSELQNWRANCWSPIAKPRLIFIPDAASSGAYTLTADSAAWQFAAQNATLRVARKLAAANAPWEFAAQNAGLTVARKITAENAPWEFAAQDATLTYAPHTGAYTLTAESAAWQFAVPDATLNYSPMGGQSGGGGWLPSLPTREERDEYVRRQREALGIIPKRIQPVAKVIKRIAKQAAKRGIEPTVEQVQEVAPFKQVDTQPIADALAINYRIYLALLEKDRQEREKTRQFIAEQIEQAKANAIALETSLRLQEEEEVFVVMSILLAD